MLLCSWHWKSSWWINKNDGAFLGPSIKQRVEQTQRIWGDLTWGCNIQACYLPMHAYFSAWFVVSHPSHQSSLIQILWMEVLTKWPKFSQRGTVCQEKIPDLHHTTGSIYEWTHQSDSHPPLLRNRNVAKIKSTFVAHSTGSYLLLENRKRMYPWLLLSDPYVSSSQCRSEILSSSEQTLNVIWKLVFGLWNHNLYMVSSIFLRGIISVDIIYSYNSIHPTSPHTVWRHE